MKTIDVHAFEDRSRPSGGHAVICLVGIGTIARNAAFELKPLDATLDEHEQEHWPSGEHSPVETRTSEAGVELIVGPGIVENPLLVPGTPVLINLPHEGISGEFLWPSITQQSRPRRRSLQAPRRGASEVEPTPTRVVEPAPRSAINTPAPLPAESIMSSPSSPIASGGSTIKPNGTAQEAPREHMRSAPSEEAPMFYASARGSATSPVPAAAQRSLADSMPKSPGGAAALAVVALLAVQGAAYAVMSARAPVIPSPIAAQASARPAETSLYAMLAVGDTSPSGASAANISPARMLELANTSLFAEGGARSTDEAAFWLKHYFIAQSGDDRVRRALTQLGSTYAAPSRGQSDYVAARQIWEIAAAKGDPIAMCFIAKLHSDGLVGPQDRSAAAQWTERSKAFGGCGDK